MAIKSANPFDKNEAAEHHVLFNTLKSGKATPAETIKEQFESKAQRPLSNRRVGMFLREMEKLGYRFTRINDPEHGRVYTMHDVGSKVGTISVEPQSYLAKRAAQGKVRAAKKTNAANVAKKAPAKKVAKKAAPPDATPVKKVPRRIARPGASTPVKAVAKKSLGKKRIVRA